MAADALDVLSFDEAVAVLNRSDTSNTELETMITAVSRRLDQACGAIVQRTLTDELHDGGRRFVRLTYRPIYSVTTVTEYDNTTAQVLAAETNSAKTANDYSSDDRAGLLYRRSGGSDARFPVGRKNVKVTYVAGRAATTTAADRLFKQAASLILGHMWRREQGGGSVTFGGFDEVQMPGVPGFFVPRAVVELLADELIGGPPLHLGGGL